MQISVWSDVACPWCYIGKRRLEAAIAQFEHKDSVTLVWRAFQLHPQAPNTYKSKRSYSELLDRKYGAGAGARTISQLKREGHKEGIVFDFDRIQPGNTLNAHRLIKLAGVVGGLGAQDRLKERLLSAYLCEGISLGTVEELVRISCEVGLDETQVRLTLATDKFTKEVNGDMAIALQQGMSGVPSMVLDGILTLNGAQDSATILHYLGKVWQEKERRKGEQLLHSSSNSNSNSSCPPGQDGGNVKAAL